MSKKIVPSSAGHSNTNKAGKKNNSLQKQQLNKQDCARVEWFFTWNNYTEENLNFLISWCDENCKKYIFQPEVGEKGTPHLQGFINLIEKRRMTQLKEEVSIKIRWEKPRNREACIEYCQKVETSTGKVYAKGYVVKKRVKIIEDLFPWQKTVDCFISADVENDRQINWIYDPAGNMGKTQMCKYLVVKHKALICTGGACKDVCNLVFNAYKAGKDLNDKWAMVFSFGREITPDKISYKSLEMVKDGLLTNTKYEAESLVFNSPHLWVFANCFPDTDKLTSDRWKIWEINEQKELKQYQWYD